MTDNTKLTRIFTLLSEAKEKGVKEVDLFDNVETSNYVGVLKHRLNKMLGCNAVVVRNAVWYLEDSFWSMTRSEFKDTMDRENLKEIIHNNNFTIVAISVIFAILLIFFTVAAYHVGKPNNIEQCLNVFDYEITSYE